MTIYYITKYALSGEIFEAEGVHEIGSNYVRCRQGGYIDLYSVDREAFTDPAAAIANAEARREKKIDSLKKQIAKLEKLTFDVKDGA